MSTRVIRVTVDGRTTTVRSTDPGRVLNVGPAGPSGVGGSFTAEAPLDLTDDVLTIDDSGYEVAGAAATAQAAAVQRANHTGTQAISTVTGLQTALDAKAATTVTDALDGRLDTLEAVDNATQAELDAHAADTTAVHGIIDTAALVLTDDARLTNSRTPTAHATSHQDGGSDELALDGSQITSGTVADARIASTIARDSEVTTAATAAQTAAEATAASALTTHAADTTSVHGIADTAALETTTGSQAKVDAHTTDATDAHDASAVSFDPTGTDLTATNVQDAVEEAATLGGGGSSAYIHNRVINGNFRTNQRGYVSTASLASGAFGFDRWKATTASTALTFGTAPAGQSVTINSGGSIAQVIEQANVEAGDYVLSWTGTATGRVYNSGGSAPSYAASPITVALDGSADVVVEFTASGGTRTLSLVQLEAGSTATPFERIPVGEEIRQCQRYYWRSSADATATAASLAWGAAQNTTAAVLYVPLPVRMRAAPTFGSASVQLTDQVTNKTITSASIYAAGTNQNMATVTTAGSSGLTAFRPYILIPTANTAYIEFIAEL